MNDTQKKMLLDWMRKIHQLEYAHRFESMNWNKWNYYFGVPSIIIAAIVGAISGICDIDTTLKNVVISIAGVIVAVLTGLQTFLKPQEQSEKHKLSSTTYEKLRHKLEYLMQFETDPNKIMVEAEKIRNDWQSVESLNVSDSNFLAAKKKVNGFNKYPDELGFLEPKNN